jgi:hypothetical protein
MRLEEHMPLEDLCRIEGVPTNDVTLRLIKGAIFLALQDHGVPLPGLHAIDLSTLPKEIAADTPSTLLRATIMALNRAGSPFSDFNRVLLLGAASPIRSADDFFTGMIQMQDHHVRKYLDESWSLLTDADRAELSKRFNDRIKKAVQGVGAFDRIVGDAIAERIAVLAEEEVARLSSVLAERVIRLVRERWETQVEQIVRARVDAAIAKIKREVL